MFAVKVKTVDEMHKVAKAADKATYRNFHHAAASISKDAKSTLEKADGPSDPGKPPHTHKGVYMRRAVRYAANKEGAVIGPRGSVVGESGAAHEFGEKYRGTDYPERPFMRPALERNLGRFADTWRGSIGE
jgi:hypothetical protein